MFNYFRSRIYWLPSQLPELRDVPRELHAEIAWAAIESIPISFWNLFSFFAVMVPIVFPFVIVVDSWGGWAKAAYVLVALPALWIWELNLVRPRVQEIVREMRREAVPGEQPPG